jgi:hypothetical protein
MSQTTQHKKKVVVKPDPAPESSDEESDEESEAEEVEEVEAETWKERALKAEAALEAMEARALEAEAEVEALKATPVKQVKVKQVCAYCQKAIGRKKSHETSCGHVFHAECYGVLTCVKSVCPTCQEVQPEPVKPVKKEGAKRGVLTYPEESHHRLKLTPEQDALMRAVYADEVTLKWDAENPKGADTESFNIYERFKNETTAGGSKKKGMWKAEIIKAYIQNYITLYRGGVEVERYIK